MEVKDPALLTEPSFHLQARYPLKMLVLRTGPLNETGSQITFSFDWSGFNGISTCHSAPGALTVGWDLHPLIEISLSQMQRLSEPPLSFKYGLNPNLSLYLFTSQCWQKCNSLSLSLAHLHPAASPLLTLIMHQRTSEMLTGFYRHLFLFYLILSRVFEKLLLRTKFSLIPENSQI